MKTQDTYKYTNNLIHEKSPYLLQHAHNPVNWFAWGKNALKKAKTENKLIIVSIGYSACHWCHVMENESFEQPETAKIMNDNFVCIKVDREERPDIDQIYMNAVQIITGNGGWPLNCIALPDGRPVYGGTYFRKNVWEDMLTQLSQKFKQNPEIFEQTAKNITNGISESEKIFKAKDYNFTNLPEQIKNAVTKSIEYLDLKDGGISGIRKFPMPVNLNFFLEYSYFNKNEIVKNFLETTLKKIAFGGIFDHLAGGFARYSVDQFWNVPHFEKMLYDNAQLISLYSNAYRYTKNIIYKQTAVKTFEFCKNELMNSKFEWYSAVDADSESEEGKYYVWTKSEIIDILGSNTEIFCKYYNVNETGNWENAKNVLRKNPNSEKLTENELNIIKQSSDKLLLHRNLRVKPQIDTKIITSQNALMITALTDMYKAFDNYKYLEIAVNTAQFILSKRINNDFSVLRISDDNILINGFLDDYAYTAQAFINLFETTGNEFYAQTANRITDFTLEHFFDSKNSMFYYNSDTDEKLFVRKHEISDNVMPSSNSVTAKNLIILSKIFGDTQKFEIYEQMLANIKETSLQNILFHANWASALLRKSNKSSEYVITGKKAELWAKNLTKNFKPDISVFQAVQKNNIPIFKNRFSENKSQIFICTDNTCSLPYNSLDEVLNTE